MKKMQHYKYYITFFICVLCFSTASFNNVIFPTNTINIGQEITSQQNKTKLIREVDKYITSVARNSKISSETIVDACLEHGVDIKFVLAQGHIESHFGTTGKASRTNSVFNIIGVKYDHPDHSIEPYLKLLNTRYLVGGKTEKDMMQNFLDKNGKRYAMSPSYESELRSTYNKIKKHTNIDKFYNIYKESNVG